MKKSIYIFVLSLILIAASWAASAQATYQLTDDSKMVIKHRPCMIGKAM